MRTYFALHILTSITYSSRNNQVHLENSHTAISPQAPLRALHSLQNHRPIEDFPSTVGAIDGLTRRAVDHVLQELEESQEGTLAIKRESVHPACIAV